MGTAAEYLDSSVRLKLQVEIFYTDGAIPTSTWPGQIIMLKTYLELPVVDLEIPGDLRVEPGNVRFREGINVDRE